MNFHPDNLFLKITTIQNFKLENKFLRDMF